MDDANPKQLADVKELRMNLSDVIRPSDDDVRLFKWLTARRFDVQKAEAMYRKSMAWREESGADRIMAEYKEPEVMTKYYPGGLCGQDKQGRPIWIDPLGRGDLKGIMFSVKKSDIIKTLVQRVEALYKTFDDYTESQGRPIHQCVHIIDMEGFGSRVMWKPALDLYIEILHILENNYPEGLYRTYIIKAPKLFLVGYNVIKQFIDKNTVAKFVVCDHHWQEHVTKDVDLDALPEYYGGKAKDPDGNPKLESKICYGGLVPETYYRKKEEFFPADSTPQKALLYRNGCLRLMFDIPDDKHVIRWIFATEASDLEFGVFRDPSGVLDSGESDDVSKSKLSHQQLESLEVVVNMSKFDVHRVPEDGMLLCDRPGMYVLLFRNPSKLMKRVVTYAVEVVKVTNDNMLQDDSKATSKGQRIQEVDSFSALDAACDVINANAEVTSL